MLGSIVIHIDIKIYNNRDYDNDVRYQLTNEQCTVFKFGEGS